MRAEIRGKAWKQGAPATHTNQEEGQRAGGAMKGWTRRGKQVRMGLAMSNEACWKSAAEQHGLLAGSGPGAASPAAVAALRHHWGAALGDDLRRAGSGAGIGTQSSAAQVKRAASVGCYHHSCPSYCNANRICLACRSRTQRDALPSPLFSHWTRFRSAGVAWRKGVAWPGGVE